MAQTNFNDLEALEISIQIEKRGEAFYTQAKALAPNAGSREMLEELAGQERDHAATFQAIYNELSKKNQGFDDSYLYEPEVSAYLRAIAESSVFPSDEHLAEVMEQLKDIREVLQIGIQAEKDSILYYTEMIMNARYVEAKNAFRRLLQEEKKHLIDLQSRLSKIESDKDSHQ